MTFRAATAASRAVDGVIAVGGDVPPETRRRPRSPACGRRSSAAASATSGTRRRSSTATSGAFARRASPSGRSSSTAGTSGPTTSSRRRRLSSTSSRDDRDPNRDVQPTRERWPSFDGSFAPAGSRRRRRTRRSSKRCAAWMRRELATANAWRAWVAVSTATDRRPGLAQHPAQGAEPGRRAERHAYLSNLYVKPSDRGGTGTALLDTVIKWARIERPSIASCCGRHHGA